MMLIFDTRKSTSQEKCLTNCFFFFYEKYNNNGDIFNWNKFIDRFYVAYIL